MTTERLNELLGICKAADDQDTGSLDEFRAAFDVATCFELVTDLMLCEQNFETLLSNADKSL